MEQEKNNTFSWVLRFATQCKGKMTASVLLAVLGSVCGIVPYFAVSQIVIQICCQNYDLIPIGFWALAALLGYLGSTWFGTVSTILSHRSAFTILRQHRTIAEASAVESPIRQETIGFPAHFFARAHNFKPPGRACQPEADSPMRT